MSKLFKLALIGLWFFSIGFSPGQKIIDVKVDKRKVETGEIFAYEIMVQGNLESPAQLKLPEFKGLKVISQSQSRNYSVKGGVITATLSFTYLLFAPKPGTYTIEPATLESKERKYQSRTITIKARGKPLKEKMKILPYIEKGTNL